MKKIIVVGSVCIDNVVYTNILPSPGTTVQGESFISNIGGKGANQACAIKYLGGDVEFFASIGNDNNGKIIENFLKNAGFAVNLKKSTQNTGIASITIDNITAENRIIIVPGANMDINKDDIDGLNFKGKEILLLQLENPIETVCYTIKKAKEQGLLVALNPAPYHELPESIFPYIDYFIPNEHELDGFVSNEGSYEDKCRYLVNKGIKNVIVTLGEKGSLLVNDNQSVNIEPIVVNAIDTTGAGDSYCGAFVTALSRGDSVIDAMKFATKASSITVTRKGAIQSLPHLDEIK